MCDEHVDPCLGDGSCVSVKTVTQRTGGTGTASGRGSTLNWDNPKIIPEPEALEGTNPSDVNREMTDWGPPVGTESWFPSNELTFSKHPTSKYLGFSHWEGTPNTKACSISELPYLARWLLILMALNRIPLIPTTHQPPPYWSQAGGPSVGAEWPAQTEVVIPFGICPALQWTDWGYTRRLRVVWAWLWMFQRWQWATA